MTEENNSPTHGDPAEEVSSTESRPKFLKCPCCESAIFRNGELKKKGARMIELERSESEVDTLRAQVQELKDKLRDRVVDSPTVTPTTTPQVETPRRKSFLVEERGN